MIHASTRSWAESPEQHPSDEKGRSRAGVAASGGNESTFADFQGLESAAVVDDN